MVSRPISMKKVFVLRYLNFGGKANSNSHLKSCVHRKNTSITSWFKKSVAKANASPTPLFRVGGQVAENVEITGNGVRYCRNVLIRQEGEGGRVLRVLNRKKQHSI